MQSSLADLYNNPPALLDYCATRLRTTYASLVNAAFAQLEAAVESDCIRDLENLQRQPALYTRHREFVLIVPDRGVSGSDPSKHHAVSVLLLSIVAGEVLTGSRKGRDPYFGRIRVH